MIERLEISELIEYLDFFPAIMLTGPRQVGKTTLAKSIAEHLKKPTLYLDMEKAEDKNILRLNAHRFLMERKDHCMIIDEAQALPEIFSALRPVIDEHRVAGRFILLGSANPVLVKKISETLAGRIYYHEITQINHVEAYKANLSLEDHWFKGGFPEALLSKNTKMWLAWSDAFIKSYVYRDLNFLFGIDLSAVTVDKIWHLLAQLNGGIENLENYSRSIGLSSATVRKYMDFLEGAYLINRLPALYINNGKRLVKSPKVYIRTSGILHYLLKITDKNNLLTSPHLGASWEAYVIEQLYHCRLANSNWHYYRTHNGAELDLVLVEGIKPILTVEIKYSNAPDLTRGYYECINDLNTQHNFIITPHAHTYHITDKIMVCSLNYFLFNFKELTAKI